MRLNTIFLPTDHCTLTCSDPVGPLLTLALSPLAATLVNLPASAANKRLTSQLSPLDATLTKTRGGGCSCRIPKAELSLYGNSGRISAAVESSDYLASGAYPRQRAHYLFTNN